MKSVEYGRFSEKLHESGMHQDRVLEAQLEITYNCNLRCRHCYTDCYNHPEARKRELSVAEIKRILDEMAAEGILWLNLTGGEVFMHPAFFEIYDHAWEKGFILSLFTNGTIFTPAILARLKERPPFVIDISCHSVEEKAFDGFTQVPGSFRHFMQGIERLRASGLPFTMKTKAMTWNLDEIPAIRQFVESLGLGFGYTTHLTARLDGDLAPLEMRLSPAQIKRLDSEAQTYREDEESCAKRRDWIGAPVENRLYRCGCGYDRIHVSAFGELGTCTMAYEYRASLREHTLKDAIREVFSKIREAKYTGSSPCAACEIYTFCEKKPTLLRWETGDREAALIDYCDVAVDKAYRLTKILPKHPLGREGAFHDTQETV